MTRFEQLYGIPLAKRRRTEILIALMALEIIFAFSYLGFIIIPPISITTMHLLVMIAAMILGTRESVAVSLVFALTSMWQAGVSGVQYSDLIFSPIQSGEPLNSLLLNSARLIGGFAAGELFKLCFARKRKHVYLCIALTTLAATWIFGTLTYLFMALLFPQTGLTVSMALMAWIEPSNLAVYVLTVLAMMLVHFALSQNGVKRYMTAVAGLEGHFKSKGLHAYYGMIVAATALCVTVMMHLIDRLKIVLGQKGYTAAFAIRSRESQILFQFFCAFSGILLLLYVTVRWIGEYHAAKSISLQKQTDALEKLKAEQILNRKLQEQNAMLESQQQQLREAAARAEAAQRESQRLADEARAANAAKTNFLARVTHDIRTPLNGIFGLLKINEMHSDDVELLRSNHEKMMVSAKHLLSLINDMLQMSKLEDGEYVLSREWVDLNELLRDVLTIVSQRAAEVGVTMTYDRNADWVVYPYIYASPLHVRQLFLNIYGNCIKYNHVGGRADTVLDCMGVENGKVTYRWTISDTGVGMSEDFLQHILRSSTLAAGHDGFSLEFFDLCYVCAVAENLQHSHGYRRKGDYLSLSLVIENGSKVGWHGCYVHFPVYHFGGYIGGRLISSDIVLIFHVHHLYGGHSGRAVEHCHLYNFTYSICSFAAACHHRKYERQAGGYIDYLFHIAPLKILISGFT